MNRKARRATRPEHGSPAAAAAAAAQCRLGNARFGQGQPAEAAACYRKAIALCPALAEAHNNLGVALERQGRRDEAAACYRQALALLPTYAEAHNNLGNVLAAGRQADAAIAAFRAAVAANSGYTEAWYNLANVLAASGRNDDAVNAYGQAIAQRPAFAEALVNLGTLLCAMGRRAEAAEVARRVTAAAPTLPEGHYNLAKALADSQPEAAMDACRRAIALRPAYADAHVNLGVLLQQWGQIDPAEECFRRALALRPDHPDTLVNLGNIAQARGDLDEAVACHRRAIALRPDGAEAHCNLAMALLARGDLAAGWAEYEWRWRVPAGLADRRAFTQPQWRGEAAAGRILLVHAEQGFGDTLQFCRLVPLAAVRGLRVVLEVQQALVRLLHGTPGIERVIGRGDDLPPFDLHCPLLSLPLALGTTLDTIPAALPLAVDPARVESWRTRLAASGDRRPRVGLAWAGSSGMDRPNQAAVDRRRSLDPRLLAPLFDLPGPHFVSLQMGGPPTDLPLTDVMADMHDFADTAALVATLDLVVSVDSAVAHLAATLGKPVWLLDRFDPCWRWLRDRGDTPWYPTLRLFRQPRPGDWTTVVHQVKSDLARFAPVATTPLAHAVGEGGGRPAGAGG